MLVQRNKVYAYVTNRDRLLVFTHADEPEAGIQVPGGTVEPGEDPDLAVVREAFEETGLADLRVAGLLGEVTVDMTVHGRAELARRRFYHLICPGVPAEEWRHWERHPSEGELREIAFDFFWVPIAAVPPLRAAHDQLLAVLRGRLAR
jgi:8-oxo-dGTP pyrophosphatase MutT (NUDIX family)